MFVILRISSFQSDDCNLRILDLDEEELGDLQNIDDEDLEDDDEEEIVLFDPSAMSQGFY